MGEVLAVKQNNGIGGWLARLVGRAEGARGDHFGLGTILVMNGPRMMVGGRITVEGLARAFGRVESRNECHKRAEREQRSNFHIKLSDYLFWARAWQSLGHSQS